MKTKLHKEKKLYPPTDPLCAIPIATIVAGIGEARWAVITKAIKLKYNTIKIYIEHRKPAGMSIRFGKGEKKYLGTIAEVEDWAKKVLKKEKK